MNGCLVKRVPQCIRAFKCTVQGTPAFLTRNPVLGGFVVQESREGYEYTSISTTRAPAQSGRPGHKQVRQHLHVFALLTLSVPSLVFPAPLSAAFACTLSFSFISPRVCLFALLFYLSHTFACARALVTWPSSRLKLSSYQYHGWLISPP